MLMAGTKHLSTPGRPLALLSGHNWSPDMARTASAPVAGASDDVVRMAIGLGDRCWIVRRRRSYAAPHAAE